MQNDLEAIEKRLLAATPGGWFVESRQYFNNISPVVAIGNDAPDSAFIAFGMTQNDAEYIVQSRQDIHNLIKEVRELRGDPGICEWTQFQDDEEGAWYTDCSNIFQLIADGPAENGMQYCPYCGKKLQQVIEKE